MTAILGRFSALPRRRKVGLMMVAGGLITAALAAGQIEPGKARARERENRQMGEEALRLVSEQIEAGTATAYRGTGDSYFIRSANESGALIHVHNMNAARRDGRYCYEVTAGILFGGGRVKTVCTVHRLRDGGDAW